MKRHRVVKIGLGAAHLERNSKQLGHFSGIGAQVGLEDGLPVIVAPFDGSPAEKAGIKAGDIIIEVDGVDVTSWPLGDIVENIRGEPGTEVELTVMRPDEGVSYEITIVRGEIDSPNATWALLPGTDVALVRLSQFSADATDELTDFADIAPTLLDMAGVAHPEDVAFDGSGAGLFFDSAIFQFDVDPSLGLIEVVAFCDPSRSIQPQPADAPPPPKPTEISAPCWRAMAAVPLMHSISLRSSSAGMPLTGPAYLPSPLPRTPRY